jgi:hypothetical protein
MNDIRKDGAVRGSNGRRSTATGFPGWPAIGGRALHTALLLGWLGASLGQAVEVVVNPSVPDTVINRSSAWALFSMRKTSWSDGSATHVFVLNDDIALHTELATEVLDTSPSRLQRAWDRLIFSGTGQAPTILDSVEEMYRRIISTPGSIGYLPKNRIDARVRVLKVE